MSRPSQLLTSSHCRGGFSRVTSSEGLRCGIVAVAATPRPAIRLLPLRCDLGDALLWHDHLLSQVLRVVSRGPEAS
jgi:hypothetical protein